jgi:[protein-PII] uridylyltransferase
MIQRSLSRIEQRGDFVQSLRDAFSQPDAGGRNREVKAVLQRQRDKIRRLNREGASGADTVRFISEMVDTLLRIMWEHLENGIPEDARCVAVIAVGGYGRMELCPQSDIDLLVLTSPDPDGYEKEQAETMIRSLWDFGFSVGSSVRSLAQCKEASAKDPETWTSFLNQRFIAGDYALYRSFADLMRKRLFPWRIAALVRAKIGEHEARRERMGSLVQMLEPNIKEGSGCLRDVHSMMWIAMVRHDCANFEDLVREGLITPQEQEDIRAAYDFLLQVRCCIHFITGKKDDRLNFHLQPEVAAELGFVGEGNFKAVEIFLKVFYHHTKTVNRVTEAVISRWVPPANGARRGSALVRNHERFAPIDGALELRVKTGNPFRGNLELIMDYFDLTNVEGLRFGHQAILRIKQAVAQLAIQENLDVSASLHRFLALCQRTDRVGRMLRSMNDVGLIGLLIPDFNYIYCHSHHDIYHIYTTDEHTITVVRQLAYLADSTERELTSLRGANAKISDRESLVLACIYHDLGKGLGAGHSVTGARLSFAFLESAGFSPSRCQLVSNLVLHHLLMNDVIQRRDLDDPKTIRDFLTKVETPSFLHNLYVLTYCDTSSVHPDAWSAWKAALLEKLYESALQTMLRPYTEAQANLSARPAEEELQAALGRVLPAAEIAPHINRLGDNYLAAHSVEEVALHAGLLREAAGKGFGAHVRARATHWEVTLAARDEKALLCRISGALAHLDLSILTAKIYTLGDGLVVDRFWVAIPGQEGITAESLRTLLLRELTSPFRLDRDELRTLRNRFRLRQRTLVDTGTLPKVLISNELSDSFTVVDVTCRDQIGILFQVALVLNELDLNVHGAVLTTEADKVLDSFYVTDAQGAKVTDASRCASIIETLERELAVE